MHYVTLRLAYADQPWAGQSSVTPQIPKMKASMLTNQRCSQEHKSTAQEHFCANDAVVKLGSIAECFVAQDTCQLCMECPVDD
eukprot:4703232-Amphidinium_carterae.2